MPVLAIAEAAYLIARELGHGSDAVLYRAISDDEFSVEPVGRNDWSRMTELVERYADQGLGGVDASVVAAAERRGDQMIATLDRRHFSSVRPRHVAGFTIVP